MMEEIFLSNMTRLILSLEEILEISRRREFLSEQNQSEVRAHKELIGSDPSLNEENGVNMCFIEAPLNKYFSGSDIKYIFMRKLQRFMQ